MLMAASKLQVLYITLIITAFTRVLSLDAVMKSTVMYPLTCSNYSQTCNSYLYHISNGHQVEQVASFYSVNTSQVTPVPRNSKQDFLISVHCACEQDNSSTQGYYLYDSLYKRKPGETVKFISEEYYSGQVWKVSGEDQEELTVHLVCGCVENESQEVVTYTVQPADTLLEIANLLSAKEPEIENLNKVLAQDPNYLDVGWVLFVPQEKNKIHPSKRRKIKTWTIAVFAVSALILLSVVSWVLYLRRKNQNQRSNKDESKTNIKESRAVEKMTLENHFLSTDMEEATTNIELEKPVVFSLEEIEQATNNFDEARKIGEGGYGSVYFGIVREREAAIKKMRSSKSKEFFAELKVLCKIHHNNVVQLLGYARGDNHLYLVYEYVQNGTLCDHLQDPFLKGHQPLSWTARAAIALDAARGIEYIHDHTKARYVHRDIKTSNILLDLGLKAKVADFGLTKFIERANEDDFIATRVVGTPGYLAPESISELQTTSKTDVFAFGVVLAELITGQRALSRDKREPNKLKTLVSVMHAIFSDKDSEKALEAHIDGNLKGSYPIEEVYKMAQTASLCLSEDPANRPEMREVVTMLTRILTSSIEWEASLGGTSQVFSGLLDGR